MFFASSFCEKTVFSFKNALRKAYLSSIRKHKQRAITHNLFAKPIFLCRIRVSLNDKNMLLHHAIAFAAKHHHDQKRETGEDFIAHPLRIMENLEGLGMSEEILTVGVLHDLAEDTAVSYSEIEQNFGTDVALMVYFLSKDDKSYFGENGERAKHCAEKIAQGARKYPEILIIKLNDQLDNLQTLYGLNLERRQKKITHMKKYFLPMYEEFREKIPVILIEAFEKLLREVKIAVEREECYAVMKGLALRS